MRLLHSGLTNACPFIHPGRVGALVKVAGGLLSGGKLTLTHIGRSLASGAFTKPNIKCVDRLVGHVHLHAERLGIYQTMAQWVLRANRSPVILVDGSDCELGHDQLMLKAAVPVGGRALTRYEEVHRPSRSNSPRTHCRFLRPLRAVLPTECGSILVTDAGLRGPWFREVQSYGWDGVGRVRKRVKYGLDGTTTGWTRTGLYSQAASQPTPVGAARVSRRHPYRCGRYRAKKSHQGAGRARVRRNQVGRVRWRRYYRAPWLLATSLPHSRGAGRDIVRLYALRLQIEETFREVKGHRWGFGLRYARSREVNRLDVLLLIGTRATLVYWLAGWVARARGLSRHFQANTETRAPVLSTFFPDRERLRSHRFRVTNAERLEAAKTVPILVHEQAFAA